MPLFVLTAIVILNSCSDEKEQAATIEGLNLRSTAPNTGKLHNEGLDYIYNLSLLKSEYNNIDELNNQVISDGVDFSYSQFEDYDNEQLGSIYINSYYASTENVLSEDLNTEIDILFNYLEETITEENVNGGNEIFDYAQSIINQPPSHLNEVEQLAWQQAVDVMGYSAIYWYDNMGNWDTSINQQKGWWGRLWRSVRRVVRADAIGAARGFVTGLISTGTLEGAGAGALAGGLGGSAGAAIKEIWGE